MVREASRDGAHRKLTSLSRFKSFLTHIPRAMPITISTRSIDEMRQNISTKQQHQQVLIQAQQYLECLSKESGECVLLIAGWEALCRLNDVQYKRSLKIIRNIQLSGGGRGGRKAANTELQTLAEACSASYLGLYKATAWQKRVERKQKECLRSLSI